MRILYRQNPRHSLVHVWSVRKVVSTYYGYCMKVRRSSDDATQEIGFTGEDLDTTSLLSFIGSNTGYIDTWYDQKGAVDVTQANKTLQPIIVNSGTLQTENSLPAILWDGSNDYLRSSNNAVLTKMAMFVVAKPTLSRPTWYNRVITGWVDTYFFLGTEGDEIASFYGNGSISEWGADITANTTINWINSFKLVASINNYFDKIYVNGLFQSKRLNPMASFNDNVIIGGRYNRNNSQCWGGTMSEIQIYKPRIAEQQSYTRQEIEADINTYFSIY